MVNIKKILHSLAHSRELSFPDPGTLTCNNCTSKVKVDMNETFCR